MIETRSSIHYLQRTIDTPGNCLYILLTTGLHAEIYTSTENEDTYSWYLVAYVQNTTPCYSLHLTPASLFWRTIPVSFDYFPQMDCTLGGFGCLCTILQSVASLDQWANLINYPEKWVEDIATTSSLQLYLHPWAPFEAALVGHWPKAASHPRPFFYRHQRLCCQYSSSL